MADVTGVRHVNKPRPLGAVKDKADYTGASSSRSSHHKVGGKDKSVHKEMKETLQQATLINIVAAVNDNYNSDGSPKKSGIDPGSSLDSLSSTMAVISNLMTPRDRTISIPRTPVIFDLPEKVVQKKPVYYKHSEDEEVRKEQLTIWGRTRGHQRKVSSRMADRRKTPTPEKVVKVIPAKSPTLQQSRDAQTWIDDPSRVINARSWSPVRRLGALNKRPDSRRVREISKCDAIDIMDTTETLKRNQIDVTGTSVKAPSPPNESKDVTCSQTPIPFYRTKSLPAMFPAKTNRNIRSVQSTRTSFERVKPRPISRGFGKAVTENMSGVIYGKNVKLQGSFSLDGTSIGHGANQEESSRLTPAWQKAKSPSPSKQTGSDTPSGFSLSESGRYEKQSIAWRQSHNDIEPDNYRKQERRSSGQDSVSQIAREAASTCGATRAGSSRPSSDTNLSDVSAVIASRNESARSKKSCIVNKPPPPVSEAMERKTPKRVQFAGTTEETFEAFLHDGFDETVRSPSEEDMAPYTLSEEDESSGPQFSDEGRIQYSPQDSITTQELARLKHRLIPPDVQTELSNHPVYHFTNNSGMQISSIQRVEEDTAPLNPAPQWHDEEESDQDVEPYTTNGEGEQKLGSEDQVFSDADEDDEEYMDTEKESLDNLSDSNGGSREDTIYRMVKAVDIDSYAGFEHRKIRKASGSSSSRGKNDSKVHYVKVKFGES